MIIIIIILLFIYWLNKPCKEYFVSTPKTDNHLKLKLANSIIKHQKVFLSPNFSKAKSYIPDLDFITFEDMRKIKSERNITTKDVFSSWHL